MTPAVWNDFKIYKGETLAQVILYTDSCGNPINLTGYTARLDAKYKIDDASAFLSLTTENGGIAITPLLGKITLNMTDTATALLVAGKGVFDMKVTSGGVKSFLMQGNITVIKMVTP